MESTGAKSLDFENFSLREELPGIALPKLSIVIPTYNSAWIVGMTLESILQQEYPSLEVIIVDAGSTDKTFEIIKSYYDKRIRITSLTSLHRYDMLNKGISQSEGVYVNFLFPGDYYIGKNTLKTVMQLACTHQMPDFIYGGSLIRDGLSDVKVLYRPFSLEILKSGQQPTSLQSCWFLTETLRRLGKFPCNYTLRGGFDLFCRMVKDGNLKVFSTNCVLTDYDLRDVTKGMIVYHFLETMKSLYHHFGFFVTVRWLFIQKDSTRFFKHWLRSIKAMFKR